ncbi:hypothetical protein REPUB_Repub02eG0086100 [Reevesia pubescens]
MAVGGFGVDGPVSGFNGKITAWVVITCIVAASSGLIFGYDIGISDEDWVSLDLVKNFRLLSLIQNLL